MTMVTIQDKYADALSTFGDVQAAVDLAVQRYTIEQITAKIAQLHQRAERYQTKYSMNYSVFSQRIAQDEAFVQSVEATITPLWELDLADWEFCVKGMEDWTRTLQMILQANLPP